MPVASIVESSTERDFADLWALMERENDPKDNKVHRDAPVPADDDQWFSGQRLRSVEFVVLPKDNITFPDGRRRPGTTRGLSAKFKEHQWNAQMAAEAHGWSNTEKELIKCYLRTLPDYRVHIFDKPLGSTMADANVRHFCQYVEVTDNKPKMCGEQVMAGSTFCENHTRIAKKLPSLEKIEVEDLVEA